METLLAVAGFVTVAAITPGPNNFIVMGAAARGGFGAAAPAIVGVVAGTLILLTLVWAGAGAVFEAEPRLRSVLTYAGSLYLIWLGAVLVSNTGKGDSRGSPSASRVSPRSAPGLAAFQLVNPKGWVMVLTATAATSTGFQGVSSLATLAVIFTAVTSVCLILWAWAGSAIADTLRKPRASRWFDRTMGGLLIGSAALLLL